MTPTPEDSSQTEEDSLTDRWVSAQVEASTRLEEVKPVSSGRWGEAFGLYGVMLALTVGLGWAQSILPWLGGYVLFMVAIGFVYLPTEWLIRRGESPQAYGIGVGRLWPSIRGALLISAIIFPSYLLVYHGWHSYQGRSLELSWSSLERWSEPFKGSPVLRKMPSGEVSLYGERDRIITRWSLRPDERRFIMRWKIEPEASLKWIGRSGQIKLNRTGDEVILSGGRKGYVIAKTSTRTLEASAQVNEHPIAPNRLRTGALRTPSSDSGVTRAEKGVSWLLYLFLVQLFLVGIPEEIFYRGYLQTRLDGLIGRDRVLWGVSFNWESTLLCSALFAFAHLATIPHPARLAVFFPSLLFGWMRRAYGNTLTPAIFHAMCNVFSQILWGFYVTSA
jgi:hypothetical protein